MNIHSNFLGGNITVTKQNKQEVYLENQLRDSSVDWFYWAFCVEGAEGKEITFNFQNDKLGYFGPAVSHDLKEWNWLNCGDESSFTYRFGENESKVYFAHSLLYHPERFSTLCERLGLEEKELCKSRAGRSVPCLKLGEGKTSIILTARHHACESTGNYVIEGILEEISSSPIPDSRILIVPFVDYDGVVEGDQGKCRSPHDHNRDYTENPIYPETKAILDYANAFGCNYGSDFHSPWHRGGRNDTVFIVRNSEEKLPCFERFSEILESQITDDSMNYKKSNDINPNTDWNKPAPTFGYTMNSRPECSLAFTLESCYFGTESNKVSAERLINLGRSFAKTIKEFMKTR